MTLSPESRAKAVLDTFHRETNPETTTRSEDGWDITALIAKAIREACNEKLEEAAQALVPGRDAMRASFAENFTTEEDEAFAKLGGLIVEFAEACMSDIRKLKEPTP